MNENARPGLQQGVSGGLAGVVGESLVMRRLAKLVARVAPLDVPALVRGESGTGKELVAAALHRISRRAAGPFVAVNGATVAGELAASALFGHERGAFTGASARRVGAFRRAHRGTLFLDEVSALTPGVQAALLRVVEEGIVLPVGSDQPIRADVRLVAATCEPLETMVERGLFRRDLYQRLSTCILWIAPLRERRGDIAAIARHIVSSNDMGIAGIDDEALLVLGRCKFPGNVRELRNVLIQAALCTDHSIITAAAVSAALEQRRGVMRPRVAPPAAVQLLSESGGNVSEAARRAGIARSTFRGLLKRARA